MDCVVQDTTTRGMDIFKKLKSVLADFELNRQDCVSICTDGAPCLLGVNNGLAGFVKDENPNIIMIIVLFTD